MRNRYSMAVGILGVVLATGACGNAARADTALAVQSELGATQAQHGVFPLLELALLKANLRPDQKSAADDLVAQARLRHQPIEQARQALRGVLASQVQTGQIDRTKISPYIDALLSLVDTVGAEDRTAIVRLHDMLDRDQRSAIVDDLEAKVGHEKGMHGREWMRRREHDGAQSSPGAGGPHAAPGSPLAKWAADLSLTDSQKDQIRSALWASFSRQQGGEPPWHRSHAGIRTLLEQFRQDQFVPAGDGAQPFGRDRVLAGIDRMIHIAEAVTPILDPGQRAKAAEKIRAMGSASPISL